MHDPDVAIQKKTDDVLHWMAFNHSGHGQRAHRSQSAEAKLATERFRRRICAARSAFMGSGAPPADPISLQFELFALDTKLDLGPDATRADVLKSTMDTSSEGCPRRPFSSIGRDHFISGRPGGLPGGASALCYRVISQNEKLFTRRTDSTVSEPSPYSALRPDAAILLPLEAPRTA